MTPSPDYPHQLVLFRLVTLLWSSIDPRPLGQPLLVPMEVLVDEINIVQPDLLFLGRLKFPPRGAENIRVAPDLAVEILSPSSEEQDRVHKKRIYARHGVAHDLIGDPENRTFEVFDPDGTEYRLAGSFSGDQTATSSLLTGLAIPLAQLWA